jgi:hypothetical protein
MIEVNLKPKNQAKKMPLEGYFQEHLVSGLVSTVPNSRLKAPKCLNLLAGTTRLELATSDVTGRRSNQTELRPRENFQFLFFFATSKKAIS